MSWIRLLGWGSAGSDSDLDDGALHAPMKSLLIVLAAAGFLLGCRAKQSNPQSFAALPTQPLSTLAEPTTAIILPPTTPTPTKIEPAVLITNTPESLPTLLPSPTPHPMQQTTLSAMKERLYPGGEIRLGNLLEENAVYRRYAVSYPSDGLNITGTMNLPHGQGPFPVVILLHGYYPRDQYWSGADSWQEADFFARNGYLAIAPDWRSWGGSDKGPSFFHTGLVADTINLISSLSTLPKADAQRIALWGHSMGGGIATKVLVIDQRPSAAVLYAPNSADDADLIARWGPGCLPGQSEEAGDKCNPGDIITPDVPQEKIEAYLAAAQDPQFLRLVAPIYHLQDITVPLQIHIGTADGAALEQTPPEWSSKLYSSLQDAGKEVEYFTYPDQGHFFQPGAWSQLMQRAVTLFDDQLKSNTKSINPQSIWAKLATPSRLAT